MMNQPNMMGNMDNIFLLSAMKENTSIYQLIGGYAIMYCVQNIVHIKRWASHLNAVYIFPILLIIMEKVMKKMKMGWLYDDFNMFFISKAPKDVVIVKDGIEETVSVKASIYFHNGRNKNMDDKKPNETSIQLMNALNTYISVINSNAKIIAVGNIYYSLMTEPFLIAPDVYCQIRGNENTDNIELFLESYSITIYSHKYELDYLKEMTDMIQTRYMYELNNKLGNHKYFFDEVIVSLPKQDGVIRYDMAGKNMIFSMTAFNTNKSFANLFGKHLHTLKERVSLFMENKQWYIERGIPYTLGIMLYGEPGTGKTSVIKAIAHDTKRHIVNIRLSPSTTQTQMKNLFFKEKITVLQDGKNEVYNIPLNERIYVIEDIDCISEVVYSRNETVITGEDLISDTEDGKVVKPFKRDPKPEMNECLTLSFLLNLFDGILETPNRILIITTNHPEKLDEALIRAGRIDVKIHVSFCDYDMIKEIYNFFYKTNREFDIVYNKPITPADLNKICIDNFNNPELAYDTIRQTVE
jgi:hypothetical protein